MQTKYLKSIPVIIPALPFIVSGFFSAWLFRRTTDTSLMPNSYLPGLLFTGTSVLVFIITKTKLTVKKVLMYFPLMYATYLAAFSITFVTGYFSFAVGIITCGLGSLATFMLTDKFITKIQFSKKNIFILGAVAFIINDFLLLPPIENLIEPLYIIYGEPSTIFSGLFLFWQSIVGIKLVLVLAKSSSTEATV